MIKILSKSKIVRAAIMIRTTQSSCNQVKTTKPNPHVVNKGFSKYLKNSRGSQRERVGLPSVRQLGFLGLAGLDKDPANLF